LIVRPIAEQKWQVIVNRLTVLGDYDFGPSSIFYKNSVHDLLTYRPPRCDEIGAPFNELEVKHTREHQQQLRRATQEQKNRMGGMGSPQ